MAVQPGTLTVIIVVALAVALAWVVLVTGSYRVLGPVRQRGLAQAGVILALAVLCLLVRRTAGRGRAVRVPAARPGDQPLPGRGPNSGLAAGRTAAAATAVRAAGAG